MTSCLQCAWATAHQCPGRQMHRHLCVLCHRTKCLLCVISLSLFHPATVTHTPLSKLCYCVCWGYVFVYTLNSRSKQLLLRIKVTDSCLQWPCNSKGVQYKSKCFTVLFLKVHFTDFTHQVQYSCHKHIYLACKNSCIMSSVALERAFKRMTK